MSCKIISFIFLLLTSITSLSHGKETELVISKNGSEIKSLSLPSLKRLQKDEVLNVFEPYENSLKKYRGFSVLPLIKKIYGKNLKTSLDTVVFYCEDGYRSDVPLEEFKMKKALLSFAMADGSPFVLMSKHSISLSPFYLTWDHPDAESVQKAFFRWPYGVNKMDLIESSAAYKPLVPQEKSEQDIKVGHQEYLKHCFSCHTLNGVGGLRGPPLNYFAQYKTTADLEKYILDPRGVNKNSQMSGLPITLPDRQKRAADIVKYLKFQYLK